VVCSHERDRCDLSDRSEVRVRGAGFMALWSLWSHATFLSRTRRSKRESWGSDMTHVPSPSNAVPRRARRAQGLEPLLTLDEVASYLSVSIRTVRRLVASGRLPCVRIGSQLRFEPADVLRFVAARKE
jgi:excisionase family DNA binding protein